MLFSCVNFLSLLDRICSKACRCNPLDMLKLFFHKTHFVNPWLQRCLLATQYLQRLKRAAGTNPLIVEFLLLLPQGLSPRPEASKAIISGRSNILMTAFSIFNQFSMWRSLILGYPALQYLGNNFNFWQSWQQDDAASISTLNVLQFHLQYIVRINKEYLVSKGWLLAGPLCDQLR